MRLTGGGLAAAIALSVVATAAPAAAIEQPAGALENVRLLDNLPEAKDATAINFLTYGRGKRSLDVMLVTGRFGLKAYSLADRAHPRLLDEVTNDELRLEGDPADAGATFWQNEDMDVDARRKLAFLSRDPRAYRGTTSGDTSVAGVYIVDAKDPAHLELLTFKQLPTGHTTTCVNDCEFLWSGGPASSNSQLAAWPLGRPIIVTDVRDPRHPVSYDTRPVDLFRADGVTGYSHDVQVDAAGVAWVSGRGGTRGYWTEGRHFDPLRGEVREATALDPVPYAGGGFADDAVGPTAGGFMHNAARPVGKDGWQRGAKRGSLLLATEEDFNEELCRGRGQFVIGSLDGSYDGEAWRSTPERPFRMRTVGSWNPAEKEGTVEGLPFCSAHYFDVDGKLVTYAWYGQGTRFLDIRDPTQPRQVAYYRPDGGNVWASYMYKGYVYTADQARGVDVLKLTHTRGEVTAPPMSRAQRRFVQRVADTRFAPDPDLGWLCPLPAA